MAELSNVLLPAAAAADRLHVPSPQPGVAALDQKGLRFIPVLAQITREVREAQRVRGLENSVTALAIPLFVRTLRMSDDIADAIEARGYRP